jgi:hypothetical protein
MVCQYTLLFENAYVGAYDKNYKELFHSVGEPDVCGNIKEACFISREKMDFLYTDAFVCKYVKVCRIATASMSLLFTRYISNQFTQILYCT